MTWVKRARVAREHGASYGQSKMGQLRQGWKLAGRVADPLSRDSSPGRSGRGGGGGTG
jgi:hypothetical protein